MTTFFGAESERKYGRSHVRQRHATDALVLLIAKDMLPLSLVESSTFKTFVSTLDPRYTLPSRKHLSTKLIKEKHEVIHCHLVELLASTECVSVTLDMWSNRQMKGFIGITCHFIKEWSMQSVLLLRFHGRHTSENIISYFHEITEQYNIGGKITNIITDNASNMLKAFQLPGFDTETVTNSNSDIESDTSDDDSDNSDEIEVAGLRESMTYLSNHDSCFAHSLQLVVKDGFKNAGTINKVLVKAAKIVTHVRKSIKATEALEGERRLQAKVATRWNSELKSIRSILSVPAEKLQQIDCQQQLTTYDRGILRDLVEILTPFEEATDVTQGQKVVTASFIIPSIRGLHVSLDSLSLKYKSPMVQTLKSSLERRMSSYEDCEHFLIAAILDPRFKLNWCVDLEKPQLKQRFIAIVKNSDIVLANTTSTWTSDEPPPQKRSRLFSFMTTTTVQSSDSTDHETDTEKTSYLAQPLLLIL